jgi:SAM-dependent methyltransferase
VTHRQGYEKSAAFYDLFDPKRNIDFFLGCALPAGKILDVGAGTGRIAIPLARKGVVAYCIEPSPAMRDEFERKLSKEPELRNRISLSAGRADTFECDSSYPMCILSGTFDHLLDHEERLAALSNISRHLHPDGVLVFDTFLGLMDDGPLRPAGEAVKGERRIKRFVGGKVLTKRRKETHVVFEIYEGNKLVRRFEEISLIGVVDRQEVEDVLSEAGFEVHREWGGYDFTPYKRSDPLLIVEAGKRGRV